MEPHPGVFTSDIETREWEPTPDYPGTEFHPLVELDDIHAGLWRITGKGTVTLPWRPPSRETMLVLEGEVRSGAQFDVSSMSGVDLRTCPTGRGSTRRRTKPGLPP